MSETTTVKTETAKTEPAKAPKTAEKRGRAFYLKDLRTMVVLAMLTAL